VESSVRLPTESELVKRGTPFAAALDALLRSFALQLSTDSAGVGRDP
jgi:hypothetical protein